MTTHTNLRARIEATINQSERQFSRKALAAFAGITEAPDAISYELPDDLPLPAAFRAEFNAWAAGLLGQLATGEITTNAFNEMTISGKR